MIIAYMFIAFIASLFYDNIKSDKNKKRLFIIMTIPLFLLAFLRSEETGTDLPIYINVFKKIGVLNGRAFTVLNYEKGYIILNWIIFQISSNIRFFIIIMALLIIAPFMMYIYKYSSNPCMSLIVYVGMGFYSQSLYIFRQYIAFVLILAAINCLQKNRLKFLLLVALAFMFHSTAILVLIILISPKIKLNWNTAFFVLSFSAVLGLLGNKITAFFLKYARINYTNSARHISGQGYTLFALLLMLSFASFIFLKPKFRSKSSDELLLKVSELSQNQIKVDSDYYRQLHIKMMFFAVMLQSVAFSFSLFTRIVLYFSFGTVIMMPEILKQVTRSQDAVISFFVKAAFFICMLVWYSKSPIKYSFFF